LSASISSGARGANFGVEPVTEALAIADEFQMKIPFFPIGFRLIEFKIAWPIGVIEVLDGM
jgi:hypothetical protein